MNTYMILFNYTEQGIRTVREAGGRLDGLKRTLEELADDGAVRHGGRRHAAGRCDDGEAGAVARRRRERSHAHDAAFPEPEYRRSEERRVGKAGRALWP